jgi:hypothetical protein
MWTLGGQKKKGNNSRMETPDVGKHSQVKHEVWKYMNLNPVTMFK